MTQKHLIAVLFFLVISVLGGFAQSAKAQTAFVENQTTAQCVEPFLYYDSTADICYQLKAENFQDLQSLALQEAKQLSPEYDFTGVSIDSPRFVSGPEGTSHHRYLVVVNRGGRMIAIVSLFVPAHAMANVFPVLATVSEVKTYSGRNKSQILRFPMVDDEQARIMVLKGNLKTCKASFAGLVSSPHLLFGNDWYAPYHEFHVRCGAMDMKRWVNSLSGRILTQTDVASIVARSQLGFVLVAVHDIAWLSKTSRDQDKIVEKTAQIIGEKKAESLYRLYDETIRKFGNPPRGFAFSDASRIWFEQNARAMLQPTEAQLIFGR